MINFQLDNNYNYNNPAVQFNINGYTISCLGVPNVTFYGEFKNTFGFFIPLLVQTLCSI